MVVQLNIVSPRGEKKVIDLCENEEQMKGITVLHLEKKITEELKLGMLKDYFLSSTVFSRRIG